MPSRRRVNVHTLVTGDEEQNQPLTVEATQAESNTEVEVESAKPLKSDTSKALAHISQSQEEIL